MKLTESRAARVLRWVKVDWLGVDDPRARRGRRHSHAGVLTLVMGAFATGVASMRAVEELCERLTRRSLRALGLKGNVSDTAAYELVKRQNPAGMAQVLLRQVKDALASKTLTNDLFESGVLAIDGKQVWVGKHEAHPECQLRHWDDGTPYWQLFAQRASLVSSSARPCVSQQFIPGKTNEVASFAAFFAFLLQHFGRSFEVVTSDSGGTSRHNAAVVNAGQKAYVFAVKENQPTIYAAARSRLGCKEMPGDAKLAGEVRTDDRAQGRDVTREIFRTTVEPGDPEVDFAGARQLWRVRQTTTERDDDGKALNRSVEDRYFIVNAVFSATRALTLVRLHWGIENGANWTMDMVLHEDDGSPCAQGEGAIVVSWLRLLAYNVAAMFRTRLPRKHGENTSWKKALNLLEDALRGLPWAAAELPAPVLE